jgi:2-amino-4-hydroxy-6-hydroxymethyldihydropteridine diphosphokinase
MATALVALGSNLGDRKANLDHAVKKLAAHPSVRVIAHSQPHLTEPIGGPSEQGKFINASVCVHTTLAPQQLFELLHQIETELGRQRRQRWAARLVDLDLLLYDDLVVKTPKLTIPHPRMAFRRFVLESAAEVAPHLVHPQIGWTIGQLLQHLNTAIDYVAVTGLPGTGKGDLARRVADVNAGSCIADPHRALTKEDARDSSARDRATFERELLRRRGELLRLDRWQAGCPLAISDFWFDQHLAYGQVDSNDAAWQSVAAEWRAWHDRIIRPKLLVMLVVPPDHSATQAHPQPALHLSETTEDRVARQKLQSALYALFSRRGQGPTLELDASAPDWAFTELSAAVEAMK